MVLQTVLHHIEVFHCRLLTQAYEQQANGEKEQVSMIFVQPSRFSLVLRK